MGLKKDFYGPLLYTCRFFMKIFHRNFRFWFTLTSQKYKKVVVILKQIYVNLERYITEGGRKELSLCHKFKFLESLHVCNQAWWCKPLIFQNKNIFSNMIYSFEYLRYTTLGLEDWYRDYNIRVCGQDTFPLPKKCFYITFCSSKFKKHFWGQNPSSINLLFFILKYYLLLRYRYNFKSFW